MIESEEPKWKRPLEGPRDVAFGERELYKLKLANSGNGAAENVILTLMPLNAGDTHPVTHNMGTIASGDERSIEIELTARQAGNLTIRVEASGDGGARVELAEHVLVRRAALQVEADGPAVQFVGTPARYRIRVHNTGDASAEGCQAHRQAAHGRAIRLRQRRRQAGSGRRRWQRGLGLGPVSPGEQRT